jgi:hypothetical protein
VVQIPDENCIMFLNGWVLGSTDLVPVQIVPVQTVWSQFHERSSGEVTWRANFEVSLSCLFSWFGSEITSWGVERIQSARLENGCAAYGAVYLRNSHVGFPIFKIKFLQANTMLRYFGWM